MPELVPSRQEPPCTDQLEAAFKGTLLLATDGLLKYASAKSICDTARGPDLDAVPCRLVELVRLRSGGLQDDVGIIACRSA